MQRRIGVFTKLAYGTGAMAFAAKDAAFINFVMFYYTQVLGVSGTLTGLAGMIALVSDAITDPIVGSLSDHTRTRWGRRHPFMAASAIPLALTFTLVFNPPEGLSELANFAWLTGMAVLLRTCLTLFIIPHTALGAELSQDYHERTLIVSYRTTLGWLAGIALPAFALTLIFREQDGLDGRLVGESYVTYGTFSMLFVLVVTFISTVFTRKEIAHLPPVPEDRQRFHLARPFTEVFQALASRNFRWMFTAMIFAGATTGVSITLGFFVNTYFWEFTTVQMAFLALPMALATIFTFAIIPALGRVLEKKSILILGVLLVMANVTWWFGLRLVDVLPANGHPLLFQLALVQTFILVVGVMFIQIMAASMIADMVDEHELETGDRREGVFFAALGFSTKAVTGFGQLIGGVIIDFVELPSGAALGSVAPDVLWKLGFLVGPGVALSLLIPLLLLMPIDLDRARHDVLRRELDRRNATRAAAAS